MEEEAAQYVLVGNLHRYLYQPCFGGNGGKLEILEKKEMTRHEGCCL